MSALSTFRVIMALVDVYNVENMHGGSNTWTALITACIAFAGTIGGIFLKTWFDERSRKAKLKRDGKTFETEVQLLEEPIKNQVIELRKYLNDLKGDGFYTLLDTLAGRLDNFKLLNRNDVIEYYENKKDSKPAAYVMDVFSGLMNIDGAVKEIDKIVAEPHTKVNLLLISYTETMQELQSVWHKYKAPMTNEQYGREPLEDFFLLMKKYFGKGNVGINGLLSLRDTLHTELRDKKFTRPEPFYIQLSDYNMKAIGVLDQILFERRKEEFRINIVITTLSNQYRRIYGKVLQE